MRFAPALALLAAVLPFAASTAVGYGTSCKQNEFWYPSQNCCLPTGGPPTPPSPPHGAACPTGYYWGQKQSCCVPSYSPPANPPTPACASGWKWNAAYQHCVPTTPTPPSHPSPPKPSQQYKKRGAGSSGSCKYNEFWYASKNCCLPNGGPPATPSPPTGVACPTGYYWGTAQTCCVPTHAPPSNPPTPACPAGWKWYASYQHCLPTTTPPSSPPKPSHYYKKREINVRGSQCPSYLAACPVGLTAGDYECVDTTSDLESCGGCVSQGKGQDCTAIKGAYHVGCEKSKCIVTSCIGGYEVGEDGKSCKPTPYHAS